MGEGGKEGGREGRKGPQHRKDHDIPPSFLLCLPPFSPPPLPFSLSLPPSVELMENNSKLHDKIRDLSLPTVDVFTVPEISGSAGPCGHTTMLLCHHVAIPPCGHTTMRLYHHVAIPSCGHTTMLPYHHVAISPCGHATMLLYHHVAIPPCGHATMWPYHHAAMPPCGHATVLPLLMHVCIFKAMEAICESTCTCIFLNS